MTECERLISEGIISSDFLKPETRCDFYVDENRKKIWAIELDLLLKFDAVCKKYNLKYFLMYGSLLGAVRHKGFIPWDDDMDVAMPRDDYEKFLTLSKEFLDPYFLQTPDTDEGYYFSFAKLRNSRTTAISKMFAWEDYNQGIFLDIFPIDKYVSEDFDSKYERLKYLGMENSTYMRMKNPNLDDVNKKRVAEYSGLNPLDSYNEIQTIARFSQNKQTDKVVLAVWTVYRLEKMIYNSSDIEECVTCKIEGFDFPIPEGYENILRTLYGDYMQLPPVDKRGEWHSGSIFNADKCYKEYLTDIRNGEA